MKATAAVTVLVTACTHHRPLREAYEVTGEATVETLDHQSVQVTSVETPTGTVFQSAGGQLVDLGNVTKITDERSLRGAVEGLGIGAGLGILAGGIIGYSGGDDPPCDECWFQQSAESKAALGAIVFGVIGGFIGLASGAVHGSHFIYEDDGSPAVIRPIGPPGSVAGLTVEF
jgi:hypothetical protein